MTNKERAIKSWLILVEQDNSLEMLTVEAVSPQDAQETFKKEFPKLSKLDTHIYPYSDSDYPENTTSEADQSLVYLLSCVRKMHSELATVLGASLETPWANMIAALESNLPKKENKLEE